MSKKNRNLLVRGSGGGKGNSGSSAVRTPIEDPDSLRSIQYARVLDLISEGEIRGLVAGAQSVFLDDTPLANSDGTFNFPGVVMQTVNGTQAQGYLPGFDAIENEVPVSTEVVFVTAVTRTLTNPELTAVRVTLGFPRLTNQNTVTGDLNGTSVNIEIYLQSDGGGFALVLQDTIQGKTTTRYQRSYRLNLPGSPPWDVRVVRATADSVSSAIFNNTWWDSYTEIIDARLAYPNSALVGLQLNAAQFQSVPRRAFEIYGLNVKVPSNYNSITRAYTGVWDGTFINAWTDNPAWCFYDMVTNSRYGMGSFVDVSQVDKWSLYSIAQYCDELIPDGFGGIEPRFRCNLYLQTREEAFRIVSNMAAIFRGIAYWGAGAIIPVADKPADAVALFTRANVIDGQFSYQGSSRSVRHTVVIVSWNDPSDAYRQKMEYVEDVVGIARYGIVQTEVVAMGSTSRGQAHRVGKWILYSERVETETVTFSVGLDGILVAPGSIIKTQDPARAGLRFGGRVVSATTTAVTIDSPVTTVFGTTYQLNVIAPSGAVLTSPITNFPGAHTVLTLASALSEAPQVNAVWVLSASNLFPETWRVIAATEEKSIIQLTALKHDPNKYAAVELDIVFEPLPSSVLTLIPPGVTDLTATETLFLAAPGIVGNRVTLSWTGTTGRYRVQYRSEFGNWILLSDMPSQTVDLDNLALGIYTFVVFQVNALGRVSPPNTLVQEIFGKLLPPAEVEDFTVIKSSGIALAQWTLHQDLDVQIGGYIVIRHTQAVTGGLWEEGYIVETFPGSMTQGFCPLMTGTYMAKALDSSGHYSLGTALFVATEGMVTGFTTVGSVVEDPDFLGVMTNVVKVSSVIQLDENVDGVLPVGRYDFFNQMDLLTVATRRYVADLEVSSFDVGSLIDSRLDLMDDWGLFDGDGVDDCDVTLYTRTTDDDPAGTPTWTEWAPFFVADFTCRANQFAIDLESGQPTHNIAVIRLRVTAKIPA